MCIFFSQDRSPFNGTETIWFKKFALLNNAEAPRWSQPPRRIESIMSGNDKYEVEVKPSAGVAKLHSEKGNTVEAKGGVVNRHEDKSTSKGGYVEVTNNPSEGGHIREQKSDETDTKPSAGILDKAAQAKFKSKLAHEESLHSEGAPVKHVDHK
jgi:hypothetical protein